MVQAPDCYEPRDCETVSDTVVRALADARDVEPTDLDVRLYDAVDPDALDRLFESATGDGALPRTSFEVGDYRVMIDESRRVFVTDRSDRDADPDAPAGSTDQILRGSSSPWRLVRRDA